MNLDPYPSIYVAACGRVFRTQGLGRQHERTCRDCHAERGGSGREERDEGEETGE